MTETVDDRWLRHRVPLPETGRRPLLRGPGGRDEATPASRPVESALQVSNGRPNPIGAQRFALCTGPRYSGASRVAMEHVRIALTISGAVSLGAFDGGALAALILAAQAINGKAVPPPLRIDAIG